MPTEDPCVFIVADILYYTVLTVSLFYIWKYILI